MTKRNRTLFNVLYCSTALSFGGEQKLLQQILSHINKNNISFSICSLRQFSYLDPQISALCDNISSLKIRGRFDIFRAVLRLTKLIKTKNIDLIHTSIFGSEFTAILASLFTRVPVVAILTTSYDLNVRITTKGIKRIYQYTKWYAIFRLHGILSRLSNIRYIALSEEVKISAISNLHLLKTKVIVNPIGIDSNVFNASRFSSDEITEIKDSLKLNTDYPILVNVARLSPVKGQRSLIESLPHIINRFPHARLLIVGDGPLHDELSEAIIQNDVQNHVSLLGRREDIAELLSVSDFFVFSSYYEGLPGAVIEAMATGKPVIAYDIPALRDVVENNKTGLLVDKRDPKSFADAVIHLAEHSQLLRSMSESALNVTRQKYYIVDNIEKLEELYVDLISTNER